MTLTEILEIAARQRLEQGWEIDDVLANANTEEQMGLVRSAATTRAIAAFMQILENEMETEE